MGSNQRIVIIGVVLLGIGLFLGSVISSRHVTVPISQPQETGFQRALREYNSPEGQMRSRMDQMEQDIRQIEFDRKMEQFTGYDKYGQKLR